MVKFEVIQSGSSIRRRLLFVALVPLIAVLPFAIRSAARDVNTLTDERESAQIAANFVEGAEVANAIRVEWSSAVDLTALSTNDFDAESSPRFGFFEQNVMTATVDRFEASTARTDELLAQSSQSSEAFAGRDDVLRRIETGRIIPAELDLSTGT